MGLIEFLRNIFCKECREERDFFKTAYKSTKESYDELLKLQIEKLTTKMDPPPVWLDRGKNPYKPSIQYFENGKLRNVSIDYNDIYALSDSLDELVMINHWSDLELDEKLKAIWKYIIQKISYAYDKGEAWQYPTTTYYRRRGDCEDGTILFVTLCHLADISDGDVFNACGWWTMSDGTKIGHSFPIAKMSDGMWYVFETTIDVVPPSPKLFKGSNYTADWGVANMYYKGMIKNGNQV